jgi:hypothetical protein
VKERCDTVKGRLVVDVNCFEKVAREDLIKIDMMESSRYGTIVCDRDKRVKDAGLKMVGRICLFLESALMTDG